MLPKMRLKNLRSLGLPQLVLAGDPPAILACLPYYCRAENGLSCIANAPLTRPPGKKKESISSLPGLGNLFEKGHDSPFSFESVLICTLLDICNVPSLCSCAICPSSTPFP